MFPMPVLIVATYDENGNPDAMNAAWGGIHNTNQIGICLDKSHKTVANLLKTKAITVSMATVDYVAACDYLGIVSANNEPEKISKSGFTVTKSEKVNAPVIDQLPMTLECSVVSYDEKDEYMVADIIDVLADESILTDGKIDVKKLKPITYDPVVHKYLELGNVVGNAFKDGLGLKK